MLLSVLIPVHNWDISALIERLAGEMPLCGPEKRVEIVAIDDCSPDPSVRQANRRCMAQLPAEWARLYDSPTNLGRSGIRNLLAQKARGEYLLFLDNDVLPDEIPFLRSYLAYAGTGEYDVVCGGVSYKTRCRREREFDFHAYHGARTEAMAASSRNLQPWRLLLTSNVMVRRSAFLQTPFREDFTGYGYEDVEWGIRLSMKFRLVHIDNTVSHLGLMPKGICYQKMRESIWNYVLLGKLHPDHVAASRMARVVRALRWVPRAMLTWLDRVLGDWFARVDHLPTLHLLYQLNKAVLVARESRTN